jgi:hypothetical protein
MLIREQTLDFHCFFCFRIKRDTVAIPVILVLLFRTDEVFQAEFQDLTFINQLSKLLTCMSLDWDVIKYDPLPIILDTEIFKFRDFQLNLACVVNKPRQVTTLKLGQVKHLEDLIELVCKRQELIV